MAPNWTAQFSQSQCFPLVPPLVQNMKIGLTHRIDTCNGLFETFWHPVKETVLIFGIFAIEVEWLFLPMFWLITKSERGIPIFTYRAFKWAPTWSMFWEEAYPGLKGLRPQKRQIGCPKLSIRGDSFERCHSLEGRGGVSQKVTKGDRGEGKYPLSFEH